MQVTIGGPVGRITQVTARVAVVTCPCGTLPLDQAMHKTSADAWKAASAHVALTGKCTPSMAWSTAPAVLVATPAR